MESNQMLAEINAIFIDVLDNEKIILTSDTTAEDIEEWDSLSHIQLIVAIEKHFKIKFTSMEIHTWKTVGQMMATISQRING